MTPGAAAGGGRERFGLPTLVTLVVGNAIGAGVYTTSGFALADLGSREWVLAAWAVGGGVALLGAVSYGMLARGLSESGGEYLYLARSIHPLAGFIGGYVSLLAGFTGAIALAAVALETYVRAAVALPRWPAGSVAIGAILFGGAIHVARVHVGARVHDLVVGAMLLGLAGFVAWAAVAFAGGGWQPPAANDWHGTPDVAAFAGSLVWISLSYSGFNAAVYVSGEAVDAPRNVPRAMLVGTSITLAIYLAVNAIFLYAPRAEAIAGQPEVAAIAAEAIGGTGLRRGMELLIAVSLLSSVTAMVLAGPRVYAKMAQDGALPAMFRMLGAEPPRAAIALQVVLAALTAGLADLRDLLSYLGLTLSLCLALAVSSLFVRHARFGERPHGRAYPWVPALFVACTLLFAVLSAARQPEQIVGLAATVAVGTAAWLACRGRR
ncbi:MAG: APC family permease [Gammaproteobacteria bacterium]